MWVLLKKYPDESDWRVIWKFPNPTLACEARVRLTSVSPFEGKLMILYQDR